MQRKSISKLTSPRDGEDEKLLEGAERGLALNSSLYLTHLMSAEDAEDELNISSNSSFTRQTKSMYRNRIEEVRFIVSVALVCSEN